MSSAPKGGDQEGQKRHRPPKKASIVRVLRALKRRYHARERSNQKDHKTNERMMARWTRNVGLFTLALVFIGIITAVIFKRQLDTMQGQLNAMEADQRPWIALQALPLLTGFQTDPNVAMMELTFNIKNTGKTPARRVGILLRIIDQFIHPDLLTVQTNICADSSKPLQPGAKYIEFTMFPGDQYSKGAIAFMFKDAIAESRKRNKEGHAVISAAIVGCIDYQFLFAEAHHQTGFIFDVLRKVPAPVIGAGIDLDSVAPEPSDLNVTFDFVGNGPAT
jgi:hypothetical protein